MNLRTSEEIVAKRETGARGLRLCSEASCDMKDIAELSEYAFESLCRDEEFILYRGVARKPQAPPLLLLTPVLPRPSLETLKKLQHEYSLRNELDATWAVRPLTLSLYN